MEIYWTVIGIYAGEIESCVEWVKALTPDEAAQKLVRLKEREGSPLDIAAVIKGRHYSDFDPEMFDRGDRQ